jgi:hypothetical protein
VSDDTLAGVSAAWAEVAVTGAAGLVALALLILEMQKARLERRLREDAEARAARDLGLERARRVVAWIEPIMWEVQMQGVVTQAPGGWKLVVSNDSDDTLSNWRAAVVNADPEGVDELVLEAAVANHGAIPPR